MRRITATLKKATAGKAKNSAKENDLFHGSCLDTTRAAIEHASSGTSKSAKVRCTKKRRWKTTLVKVIVKHVRLKGVRPSSRMTFASIYLCKVKLCSLPTKIPLPYYPQAAHFSPSERQRTDVIGRLYLMQAKIIPFKV